MKVTHNPISSDSTTSLYSSTRTKMPISNIDVDATTALVTGTTAVLAADTNAVLATLPPDSLAASAAFGATGGAVFSLAELLAGSLAATAAAFSATGGAWAVFF